MMQRDIIMLLAVSKALRTLGQVEGKNVLGEMSPTGTDRMYEVFDHAE